MNQSHLQESAGSSAAPGAQPKQSHALLWILFGVSSLVFVGFFGLRVKASLARKQALAAEQAKAEVAAKVETKLLTMHPTPLQWRPSVEITGTLRPWKEADISFETQGRLVTLSVSVGDTVQAGQLLGTLDASRAGAQVNQAQAQTKAAHAQVALAEDNLKRTEALVLTKSIPEAQAEQARQNVALARAQLEAAEATTRLAQVGQGVSAITAPFAGVVTKAPSSPGAVVNPGVPLMRIEDISHFRLMGSVGEEDVASVTVGAPVVVRYLDRTVTGKVTAIVPSLDQNTRRAPVEIEVPNTPGQPLLGYGFVRARIDSKQDVTAWKIPLAARRRGSQDEVITVVGGKAHVARVAHSTLDDGSWIVRSGLTEADVVLLSPSTDLQEGDAVVGTSEAPPAASVGSAPTSLEVVPASPKTSASAR